MNTLLIVFLLGGFLHGFIIDKNFEEVIGSSFCFRLQYYSQLLEVFAFLHLQVEQLGRILLHKGELYLVVSFKVLNFSPICVHHVPVNLHFTKHQYRIGLIRFEKVSWNIARIKWVFHTTFYQVSGGIGIETDRNSAGIGCTDPNEQKFIFNLAHFQIVERLFWYLRIDAAWGHLSDFNYLFQGLLLY